MPFFDHSRSDTPIWRWRNLWRGMLPPGLVIFPFQSYPTLVYFWNTGAALRWVYLSWSMTSVLFALDLISFFAPSEVAALLGSRGLAELRVMALPLYMVFVAMAVVDRCLWWKVSGRLDELLVTCLTGNELLPILWVPPAAKIMSVYGAGFFAHIALAGNWSLALDETRIWIGSFGARTMLTALVEFLLGLLLMRAATICALFGAIKSKTAAGITGQALVRAIEYIVLAVVGAMGQLMGIVFVAAMSLVFGVGAFKLTGVVLTGIAAVCLLRQLTMDTLEDYQEFRMEWREYLVK